MRATNRYYDVEKSHSRIRGFLEQSDLDYAETNYLPVRDSLSYNNGFYSNCAALFIDIQDSSKLPNKHKRPALAKMYRSFISESVAIINSHAKCREVSIVGDGVWGVFNTPNTDDIDDVLDTIGMLGSMMKILNYELSRRELSAIRAGIGASWGRALMVKVGASGTGIDDVVYMGDVVNEAAHLSAQANRTRNDPPVMISADFYFNLKDSYKEFFVRNPTSNAWQGAVHSIPMQKWYSENLQK